MSLDTDVVIGRLLKLVQRMKTLGMTNTMNRPHLSPYTILKHPGILRITPPHTELRLTNITLIPTLITITVDITIDVINFNLEFLISKFNILLFYPFLKFYE